MKEVIAMKFLFVFILFELQVFGLNLIDRNNPDQYIVGGNEARPEQFPFLVSIRRTNDRVHICGGAIVNVRWILSVSCGIDFL